MSDVSVLVTGSNGRLGRAITRIAAGGTSVLGMPGPRGGAGRSPDITDANGIAAAIAEARPRAIIHLAAIVGAACEADAARTEAVNVAGARNVVAAAQRYGVERVVFASTSAVYGDQRRRPVSEKDQPEPSGAYAMSKLRAEEAIATYRGVNVDVLRVFNIYGPGMPDSLVARLQSATIDAPARLSGLDSFVRDYVHVDDVARAFLAAARSSAAGVRTFNVGSGIPRSNRDLLDELPASRRAAVTLAPELESYSCAVIDAISEGLDWRPLEPWPPAFPPL